MLRDRQCPWSLLFLSLKTPLDALSPLRSEGEEKLRRSGVDDIRHANVQNRVIRRWTAVSDHIGVDAIARHDGQPFAPRARLDDLVVFAIVHELGSVLNKDSGAG